MNFDLPGLPDRCDKPRDNGLTMMMDKGLSIRQVEDTLSASHQYIDIAKLGFGTSMITNNLQQKLDLYKAAEVRTCFGGTLFELFYAKGLFDDYRKLIDKYDMPLVKRFEEMIDQVVLSEVGSKDADNIIPPYKWIQLIETELEAGAWMVYQIIGSKCQPWEYCT